MHQGVGGRSSNVPVAPFFGFFFSVTAVPSRLELSRPKSTALGGRRDGLVSSTSYYQLFQVGLDSS